MKINEIGLVAAVAFLWSGCATAPRGIMAQSRPQAEAVIAGWSQTSRAAAARLLEKYGTPDLVSPSRLVWRDKGLVSMVEVWDQTAGDKSGAEIIELVVDYRVPPEKEAELASFSDRVQASPDGKELVAWAQSEEAAILALNLSNEIILGIKSPEEARDLYDRTLELSAAGKSSPFMEGLLFLPIR
jgi:hypothetical protein